MNSHDITAEDLLAFQEVLKLLNEEASEPGMPVERAAALIAAIEQVRKDAADTIALLKSRAIITLEKGKQIIGDTVYSVGNDTKKRPAHDKIDMGVRRYARWDEQGEAFPTEVAVDRAIAAMRALFVAPATAPKAEGLRKIKLSFDEAIVEEITGKHLKVTEL